MNPWIALVAVGVVVVAVYAIARERSLASLVAAARVVWCPDLRRDARVEFARPGLRDVIASTALPLVTRCSLWSERPPCRQECRLVSRTEHQPS